MDGNSKLDHDPTASGVEIVKINFKNIEFAVTAGDIMQEFRGSDAIVIPSSPELDLQSGVVENLVNREYGDGPFKALDAKKKQMNIPKYVPMCTAVDAIYNAKDFIFVNIQPPYDVDDQSFDGVKESAFNCFTEANFNEAQSIVIPALGNGMWGVPLDESVKAIAEAAKDFIDKMTEKGNEPALRKINVVLFRPKITDSSLIKDPVTKILT